MSGILSVEDFRVIIEKERERSDRTGLNVSLVVFEVNEAPRDTDPMKDIVTVLHSRVRSIDEIGWFDKQRVGVVLPYTARKDARRFAEIVLGGQAHRSYPILCRIFTYPSTWPNGWNGNNHNTEQLQFSDVSDRWKPIDNSNDIIFNGSTNIRDSKHGPGQFKRTRCTYMNDEILLFEMPLCFSGLPFWKRALDIIGALAGIILLLPIIFITAFAVKLISPGPVLFKQERVGHLGKIFRMLKFRTMHVDAKSSPHEEYLGKLIANDIKMRKLDDSDDPRIFWFGKVLRKTALDELPQLINVLVGEMSLVGPRPCLPYEAEKYVYWHAKRFDAVPGLTGLWQVSGKNRTTFKEMIRLDINYTRNRSISLDLLIILKTFPAVMQQVAESLARRKERSYAEEH